MTDYAWTEPVSGLNSKYPYNNVTATESGHFQEWDDTPGAERIRTQHKSGTFTEMHPDGSVVNKIYGKNYTIVAKDNNVLISGVCNITINGDSVLNVSGDCYQQIKGNFNQVVEKDYNLLVKGEMNISGTGAMNISNLAATGEITLTAADKVSVQADMNVDGEILGDSISSEGSITAGTGIHAGVIGSANPIAGISTLGGINAGIPGPTAPGIVYANKMLVSPLSIAYVMSYGSQVYDIFGSMNMIRIKYDLHKHTTTSPGKPTTNPLPQYLLP